MTYFSLTDKKRSLTLFALLVLVAASSQVLSGKTLQLAARVLQRDSQSGIVWTTTAGSISSTGLFTAPVVSTNTNVTITARSAIDSSKSVSKVITVERNGAIGQFNVLITKPTSDTQSFYPSETVQISAFVGANPQNTGIAYTLTSAANTNNSNNYIVGGGINSTGLVTIPKVGQATTLTIRATSLENSNKFATITLKAIPFETQIVTPFSTPSNQVRIAAGERIQLSGHVFGDPTFAGVTWTASSGTISSTGLYTSPTTPSNPEQQITITARSVADTQRSATQSFYVRPSTMTVTAGIDSSSTLTSNQSLQVSSFILNNGSNGGVNYSLSSSAGTTPSSVGSISTTGVYTAPSVISVSSVRVTATSQNTPNLSAFIDLPLTALPLSISAALPSQNTVMVGQQVQFNANQGSVTWATSDGSISPTGLFTAPSNATSNGYPLGRRVVITATSTVDSNRSASYEVFVQDQRVLSIAAALPTDSTIYTSEQVRFSSAQSNDLIGGTVTWTATAGTISSTGLFTAPNTSNQSWDSTRQRIVITATNGSNNQSVTREVFVKPMVVSLNAALPTDETIYTTEKIQLSSFLIGDSSNAGVTWSSDVGTISATGLYTAPNTSNQSFDGTRQRITITATSVTDPSRTATRVLYVRPLVVALDAALPSDNTIFVTEKVQFSTQLLGDLNNQGVTWTTNLGSIDTNGLYTAPNTSTGGTTGQAAIITATSLADPSRNASKTINVRSVEVNLKAALPDQDTIYATQTAQFSASVLGDSSNTGVTWSSSAGSISPTGLFTAPLGSDLSWEGNRQRIAITATSQLETNRSATTYIYVAPNPVQVVAALPSNNTIFATQTLQLAAATPSTTIPTNVTWTASVGTISSNGLYTAPNTTTSPSQEVTVTATSTTDSRQIGTRVFYIAPLGIALSAPLPVNDTISATDTIPFTANVLGDRNQASVTWAASVGTIDANGLYTAPKTSDRSFDGTRQQVVITATSNTDTTRNASRTMFIRPMSQVSLSNPFSVVRSSEKISLIARTPEDKSNSGVLWSTNAGSITQDGVLTAPKVLEPTAVTVTATSKADNTNLASISILVTPVQIVNTVSPVTDVAAGDTVQLSSKVYDLSPRGDTGVTWSTDQGTISSTGVYSAPSSNPSSTVYPVSITATANAGVIASNTSNTKNLSVKPIQVQVSSSNNQILAGSTTQLRAETLNDIAQAGVTWSLEGGSLGSISASGIYTAPNTIASNTSITARATSKSDTSRSATLTLNVATPSIQLVSPNNNTQLDSYMKFAATVKNDSSNMGVTWSADKGFIGASGRYTAPTSSQSVVVTITATSKTYPSLSASTTLTLNPDVVTDVTGWRNRQQMGYDKDNRREVEFIPAMTGTVADAKFDYLARRVLTTYTEESVTPIGTNMVFTNLTKVTRANQLGGLMTGGGEEQSRTETTLDARGRLEKTERIATDIPNSNRTTSYEYAASNTTSTPNTLNEDTLAVGAVTNSIKLYQDQVISSTESSGVLSRKTIYAYDALGFGILTRQEKAYAATSDDITLVPITLKE